MRLLISSIIAILQANIVGESSDVIMARITQKGKTAEKFTAEIDNLRRLLEASYIDEGLQAELADKFSTKEAINTITKNCEHGRIKTILEAGNFTTMNEATTKFIQCSTESESKNNSSVFYTRSRQAQRGSYNNRGNYRGRGYGHGYYNRNHNNNISYNNNYNHNNGNKYRGRGRNYSRGNNNNQNGNYSARLRLS